MHFAEVESLPSIGHISCGAAHSMFVSKDGRLFGVGSNSCG